MVRQEEGLSALPMTYEEVLREERSVRVSELGETHGARRLEGRGSVRVSAA